MALKGKRYRETAELVEHDRSYEPREAIALAKETATAKFDEAVELHIRTGCDPRHADQLVRGVVVLPHGVGKAVRVLVFTKGEAVAAAESAGADYVGDEELIKRIEGGWTDFDVAIATPDVMGSIGKLGRVLGRKGLMPNPRTGTVVQPQDIRRAVDEAKKGRVEYRVDRTALIHVPIGRASFDESKLYENLTVVMEAVVRARPSGVKGQYIRGAYLATTMGPSIKLDVASATALRVE